MYDAGNPKPVLCDNLEAWGGGGHMYACDWFMLMYGRGHHNIVIILQLKLIHLKKW